MTGEQNVTAFQEIEQFARLYGDRLLRAAVFMCRNEADAHDLVQETFLQAMGALARFNGDAALYTWLYRIMRNLFLNNCRRNRWLQYFGLLPDQPAEREDLDDLLTREETHAWVMANLCQLPFKHREILLLRHGEGLKIPEIAQLLNISPGTVKSRLHWAMRRLQRKLSPELAGQSRSVIGEHYEM